MSYYTTTSTLELDSWEKARYLSLTLWDIDREFQKSYEAYEQWLGKNRRKKMIWECFGVGKLDHELGKYLRLGRRVRELLESGIEAFGSRFEQGDSTCNAILSAQLLRVQQEIRIPVEDVMLSRARITMAVDDILKAAKSVRRTCVYALRDQYARLQSPNLIPFLPPPRFSVNFCPFAAQLLKEGNANTLQAKKKVRPHDRHDEREICPYCSAHISVSKHTGLADYRRLLFQAHLCPSSEKARTTATFACTGCYKTFEDSYGFLDHVFQKEIGSDRSCQKRWSSQWHLNNVFLESNPTLVEKCLRNCLKREIIRVRALKKTRALDYSGRSSTMTTEKILEL